MEAYGQLMDSRKALEQMESGTATDPVALSPSPRKKSYGANFVFVRPGSYRVFMCELRVKISRAPVSAILLREMRLFAQKRGE